MQTLRSLRCIVLFYTRSSLIRENRELLPKRGFPAVLALLFVKILPLTFRMYFMFPPHT